MMRDPVVTLRYEMTIPEARALYAWLHGLTAVGNVESEFIRVTLDALAPYFAREVA